MLTLFADASFCPKTGAAGWGAWAKRDGWMNGRFYGGPMRRPFKTSNSAEICGIASALHEIHAAGSLEDVETVIIQCDNVVALGMILSHVERSRTASRKGARDVDIPLVRWAKCDELARKAISAIRRTTQGKTIWLRHIRGHGTDDTTRSWVNEQCDAEAKRHMNSVRDSLRATTFFEAIEQ
jgi:ribonuclease HI